MPVTDAQVRKMNEEYSKHNNLTLAAIKAGMDRKTARKYRDAGATPSQLKAPRTWRTRKDPFEGDWPKIQLMLEAAPELEAKTVFEHLLENSEVTYHPGQLRTLQRRVRDWRARAGPPKEVFFPQNHVPGEAAQTDFTWAKELQITIAGQPFPHMLCHLILPYSNWEWATICFSESMAALRDGVQAGLFRLGRRPDWHQTDNSSAATHRLSDGKRSFNDDYAALMRHLGMKPRTTGIGKKEQNGDIESMNGVLKRRLKQHLLLRGSTDFDSVDDYRRWLEGILERANALRGKRVQEELAVMKPLLVERLPDYTRLQVNVTKWSTIRVKHNTYSVPSRLIGEQLDIRLYENRLEIFHGDQHQATIERLHGRHGHFINYRHVIWSLVRKPWAFERYRYRSDLFPTVTFRRAYDALAAKLSPRKADLAYLRVLHLAASTIEEEVETALECLLEVGAVPLPEQVKALVEPSRTPSVPQMAALEPDLAVYDGLLSGATVR